MTVPQLRDYQLLCVSEIRRVFASWKRRVLFVLPTGGGKTIVFVFIVTNAIARENRTLIIVHRQELIDQVAAALDAASILYGIIAAGYPERPLARVQIASIQTLAQRLDRYADAFDFIVVDEAHHAVAQSWQRVLAAMPNAKVLGVTATPQRRDGRGLGSIFDAIVIGPGTRELIPPGYLSNFRFFVPANYPDLSRVRTRAGDFAVDDLAHVMGEERLTDDVIGDYERICGGAPTVVFCVDVRHSMGVAKRFQARGHKAAHVDGNTPRDERRRLIAALGNGELQILTNCGLISEGLDVPAIGAAILLRPTKSLALYLQQVGRALRPAPGKERALILDYSGNVIRHGFPDEPRAWSLQGTARGARLDRAASFTRCGSCGALNVAMAAQCSACGATIQPISRAAAASAPIGEHQRRVLAGMSYARALEWAGGSVPRLKLVAGARNYKPGWVWARVAELRTRRRETAA